MASAGYNPAVLSAQYSEIPDALKSSQRKKPIPLSVKTMAVASQSGTATSGSQINFQISSANGFIKPSSMFIKCRVTLVASAGSAPAGGTVVAWGNSCRNSSSCLERINFSSGAVLESINNYGSSYIPTLLLHCSNQNYINGDDKLLEGGYRASAGWDYTTLGNLASSAVNSWVDVPASTAYATANTFVDVCIPMYSNLFSNEKAYPLALMAQSTLISVDLAVFGKAMYQSTAGAYTDYSISNAQICYDLIQVSPEYLMALKAQMAQGMLYSIPFTSVLSTQYTKQGANTSYSWGVGLSSLKGVTYSCMANSTSATDPKYLFSDASIGTTAGNNFRLFIDGQQQSSVVQDTTSSRYSACQLSFGLLTDVSRTVASGGILTYGATDYAVSPKAYEQNFFVGGQGCMRVNEAQTMAGSQANNLSLILETNATTANTIILANCFHDRILVIDANGSCNIVL